MWAQIGNWLYQNAMAIFISAIASLLISKRYYDKANRESVFMTVIFPIVKLLNQRYYTSKDYETLFEINSSYAVKYLRKRERNKLLELLSAYRDVCRYSKEGADTSCIMAYYNFKLKENGVNPKPCTIRDDDGEVVADDFPPDYNYLQDYVYEIVSSYDFIESPDKCTVKIADAFKCYAKKYYNDENIVYFEDYSIEKVIELSEVSKKWNEKFKLSDECKEEFLKLPICKKVKDIIDKAGVNEYVNRKKDEKEYNFKEYEQRRIRDNMILEDVKKANEEGGISQYSEEQIQQAQKEEGKKAINALYYERAFPLMNNILFVVYYVLSLITLPLIYLKQDFLNKIVVILGYLALIIIVAVIEIINKFIHNNKFGKTDLRYCLEKFSLDMSIVTYLLTSMGYMLVVMDNFFFWYVYISMLLLFGVAVYFDIVKPLIRGKDSVSSGTMN